MARRHVQPPFRKRLDSPRMQTPSWISSVVRNAWRRDALGLALLCALMFGWRLGQVGLIDPDEPFYAQSATEMLAHHDWVTPRIFGHPQFEKPILFYWLEMGSIAWLGRNELAERLPAATFGVLLVLMTYAFGARRWGLGAGRLGALVLATSILFAGCCRFVLTDVVFALFVCASCFASAAALDSESRRPMLWMLASACSGLAVLTKGPLGVLIPLLAGISYAWVARMRPRLGARELVAGIAVFVAIAAPWYGVILTRYGGAYARAFFLHENLDRFLRAEHRSNDHPLYYVAVLIAGALPWLPALALAVLRTFQRGPAGGAWRYLQCWIVSSLLFFTAARSKLPTYVLFLFPPGALVLGVTLQSVLDHGFRNPRERRVAIAAGIVQAAAFLAVLPLPALGPVRAPLGAAALGLGLAAVLLGRGAWRHWIVTTSLTSAAIILLVTGGTTTPLEAWLSTRPVAALLRASASTEPVLASPKLVRGVAYYSGFPAIVIASRPRPFWSAHPVPVVVGSRGLVRYTREAGPVRCVMRTSEWRSLARDLPHGMIGDSVCTGDKVVVQILPEAAPNASPRPNADHARD